MKSTVLILAIVVSCGPLPKPDEPVAPDAGDVDDCADFCDNLTALECPGWRGSPGPDEIYDTADDVSCHQVCVDMMTAGIYLSLFPKCGADAETCEQVDACFDVEG